MATPIPITDPHDPRIAAYRDIRERDAVGRQGRFIIEGDVVLRLALRRGRFPLESVLLSRRRFENDPALAAAIPKHVPLLVAEDAVIERTAGFDIHRGVVAVGLRGAEPSISRILAGTPEKATVVICVGIANHDNMGGIFRNAAAFGAAAVLLDATSCDPLYRKAIRVSVGAALVVPFRRGGTAIEIVAELRGAGFSVLALSPAGEHDVSRFPLSPRTALVLGAEGPGLPADVLAETTTIRINMAAGFDSLNVATTSGIALHAIFNR